MRVPAKSETPLGPFSSEAAMVATFVSALRKRRTCFGPVNITLEWNHGAGYVDVLARDRKKSLVAFEAKLGDWKRAFMQAYRNTAYADRTYVLLPTGVADRALRQREMFEERGIGLCGFDGVSIEVLLEAAEQPPLLPWIQKRAHEHFNGLPRNVNGRAAGCRGQSRRPAAVA